MKTRASKKNPYFCEHCGYRIACYATMKRHLREAHDDRVTDPRVKWLSRQPD